MLDYESFQFAAPPACGGSWVVKTCLALGLGHCDERSASEPFSCDGKKFRLSMVRNPKSWLATVYFMSTTSRPRPFDEMFDSGSQDFYSFLCQVCHTRPGAVGELFDSYRADTVMRWEDQPHALFEFLRSADVRLGCLQFLPYVYRCDPVINWTQPMRVMLAASEKDILERYNYVV